MFRRQRPSRHRGLFYVSSWTNRSLFAMKSHLIHHEPLMCSPWRLSLFTINSFTIHREFFLSRRTIHEISGQYSSTTAWYDCTAPWFTEFTVNKHTFHGEQRKKCSEWTEKNMTINFCTKVPIRKTVKNFSHWPAGSKQNKNKKKHVFGFLLFSLVFPMFF